MKHVKRALGAVLALAMLLAGLSAAAGEAAETGVNPEELTEAQSWWIGEYELYKPYWDRFERVPMPEENWFWVYRLPENAYAIYEPYQTQMVISYLILGEETALLWDTGLGIGNIRACVDRLTDLPVTVLNSHDHFDHIGGNALFDRVMCYDIGTAVETLTEGIPHEELMEMIEPEKIINLPEDFDAEGHFTAGKAPTATVEDGQVIDLGGRKLEVIYTPGHDDAAIMLIDEENGLLFTGDTWYPGWLYYMPAEAPLDMYVDTMKKVGGIIRERKLRQLYPSHNAILEGTECFDETTAFLERVLTGEEKDYEIVDDFRLYTLNDLVALLVIEYTE